jgi:hypothetical protein
MAINPGTVSVTEGSGKKLDTATVTVSGNSVEREIVAIGSPDASTPTQYAAVTSGGALKTDASATTQPVSAASLPLPAGAATDASVQAVTAALGATLSVAVVSNVGAGGLTNAQLRSAPVPVDASGATVPVSASALPLPTGASTAAKQDSGNTSVASIDTKTPALVTGRVPVDGSGVTQPVSLSGSVTVAQATAANLKVDLSGTGANTTALKVDGSAVTQPVSISGTVSVTNASPGLPTGAATAAKQPAPGTAGVASADVLTVQGVASMTALKVDGSAVTQPVSGTFWQATQPVSLSGNQNVNLAQVAGASPSVAAGNVAASTLRVVIASDQVAVAAKLAPQTTGGCSVATVAASSTASSIKSSAGTVTAISIFNPNTAPIFLNFYDIASGSVTAGTSTQKACYGIPAGGAFNLALDSGLFSCATAISIAVTTTDTGGSNPSLTARCTVHYV